MRAEIGSMGLFSYSILAPCQICRGHFLIDVFCMCISYLNSYTGVFKE